MNILAGRFKGVSIKTTSKMPYRPTKSRVRKSLFDKMILFNYDTVLDLFSGSGIMGFEAASRGASKITFVEKHSKSLNLIRSNSTKFNGIGFDFIKTDVFTYLKNSINFDLIFADPPYGRFDLEPLTISILEHLNRNGKFILECEKNQQSFLDADVSDYGDTRILTWTNS